MGVEKDAMRLNRAKSKVRAYGERRAKRRGEPRSSIFLRRAPRRSRFRARTRVRPKKVIVVERVSSGERCGRLSSIYMYFPLFLVIILREKLSRARARAARPDASSGDALSNLRTEDDSLLICLQLSRTDPL